MKSSNWEKLHSLLSEVLAHEKEEAKGGADEGSDIEELEEALKLCKEHAMEDGAMSEESEAPESEASPEEPEPESKGKHALIVSVGLHKMPMDQLEKHVRKMSADAGYDGSEE